MIDRLQITFEPYAVFAREVNGPVVRELRIKLWANGKNYQYVQHEREDDFTSLFDHIFDEAKRCIKGAMSPAPNA